MGNPERRRRTRSTKKRNGHRLRIVVGKDLNSKESLLRSWAVRFQQWSVWIPYDLPPQNTQDRIEVAKILDGDQKPLVSRCDGSLEEATALGFTALVSLVVIVI